MIAPEASTPRPSDKAWRARRSVLALALFVLTLTPAAYSLSQRHQLGTVGGFTAAWTRVVLNYAIHGTVGLGSEPTVFKMPGYPLWAGGLLRLFADVPPELPSLGRPGRQLPSEEGALLDAEQTEALAMPIYVGQALLLAGAAVLLFFWLQRSTSLAIAFAAGLTLGVNPYTQIFVGVLHYAILHVFLLVLASLTLERAIRSGSARRLPFVLTGAAWGLATLVRPTSILLPLLVLIVLVWRDRPRWREAGVRWLAFVGGIVLALAPYTVRNFRLTGTLLPVSAQAWAAVFGSSARAVDIDPNHFRWKMVREDLLDVQATVRGERTRRGWEPYGVRENLALEDAYRTAALRNLRRQPEVYLGNALRSFATFSWHVDSVFIQLFEYVQTPGAAWPAWDWPGTQQTFFPRRDRRLFERHLQLLELLALAGIVAGIRRRDSAPLVPAVVLLALAGAHALSWTDVFYYYAKIPFVIALAFVACRAAGRRLGEPIALTLAGLSCALTIIVLWV